MITTLFTFTSASANNLTVRVDTETLAVSVANEEHVLTQGTNESHPYVGVVYPDVAVDADGSPVSYIGIAAFPYAEVYTGNGGTPNFPADGTFIRTQCYGFDLYNVVADGEGGERQGTLVEANSISCGYVAPVYGCTDPEAENYDPNATHDNGTCTYAPKVFTEVKTIDVMPCTDGICLRWFNSLGGVDTWVFSGKVDRPFSSEATGEYTLANGLTVAASKGGNPTMALRTSSLNYNRYTALWQLFTSPKVWIHHADGGTEEVYVRPSSISPMPLGRRSYDLTVEISKAPINSLRN